MASATLQTLTAANRVAEKGATKRAAAGEGAAGGPGGAAAAGGELLHDQATHAQI